MAKFKKTPVAGFLGGLIIILLSISLGGKLSFFFNLPALLMTIGGSFFASLVIYDLGTIKNLGSKIYWAFTFEPQDAEPLIELAKNLAQKVRQDGIMCLEEEAHKVENSFFRKGVELIIEAESPEYTQNILQKEIQSTRKSVQTEIQLLKTWALLAPAFGLLGGIISLIQLLFHLRYPGQLGAGAATALLPIFYGLIISYLFCFPLVEKLELQNERDYLLKTAMLECIMAIQSGLNPRRLEEKLRLLLDLEVVVDA
ncbi:MotA/TolQ/ExbB proton channel family protein [Bacillota bacterium LX-D]|nr:MotA/TolQ/ExbB proton channel family protein [Bacillota bacterium LX-D]